MNSESRLKSEFGSRTFFTFHFYEYFMMITFQAFPYKPHFTHYHPAQYKCIMKKMKTSHAFCVSFVCCLIPKPKATNKILSGSIPHYLFMRHMWFFIQEGYVFRRSAEAKCLGDWGDKCTSLLCAAPNDLKAHIMDGLYASNMLVHGKMRVEKIGKW